MAATNLQIILFQAEDMKAGILQKVVIITGIGVGASLSAALIRFLLSKRQNGNEDRTNNLIEVKLDVPRKSLGYLIGKRGATIRRIREETGAAIRFWDENEELAVVYIRGQQENVEAALKELKRLIASSPRVITKEVFLTEGTWATVVGVNGDNVRYISSESKAALTVKWLVPHEEEIRNNCSKYVVTVRGSQEQIDHALSLIDESVAKASVIAQKSKTVGVAGRSLLENVVPTMQVAISQEVFLADSADGFVQVFVSAVQTPNHFWVQLCGPKSVQLDKLISEMTDFYKNEVNNHSTSFSLESVVPGELVAAYYDGDNDWYRALVLSVEKLTNSRLAATVLFVDFGDSAVVELGMIMKLKPEYLAIPLQAIKCSLSDVLPIDDGRWSQDAIRLFESLTYLAQWKPIMAKPVSSERTATSDDDNTLSNETADIVQVILVDTNGVDDINVAEELIKAGYALRKNKKETSVEKCLSS